jgi:hypothetical protein
MSEMVEQAARALAKKRYSHCGSYPDDAESFVKGIKNWEFCVDDVKVVIRAMREPTQEMEIVAGHQGYVIKYYQAMIDEALK